VHSRPACLKSSGGKQSGTVFMIFFPEGGVASPLQPFSMAATQTT
jgi:hypothetical protein